MNATGWTQYFISYRFDMPDGPAVGDSPGYWHHDPTGTTQWDTPPAVRSIYDFTIHDLIWGHGYAVDMKLHTVKLKDIFNIWHGKDT